MTREENIETTRTFVRLLEQRRLEEFSELFAEDGKWIHPYHSGLFPAETVGRREKVYDSEPVATKEERNLEKAIMMKNMKVKACKIML